ncbi:MASE3 domain-containing protein [Halalkalibacter akibai]|uniref:histidine kinase n=1 Tax=Halalkalibacter akibai (strain ATCC 43226 / DSM 21942 / CIP 109018 / JCM 9157 / 1139) TaxID=1236973 RepID=W4QVM0_HALA3|nr:MASE3 domain-containing protein [Halalkalibacter akibai]GAE35374.1 sensor histidine kinase [Halalkalibacter akibai JCM 9157]
MLFDKNERNTMILGFVGLSLFLLVFFQGIQTNMYHLTDHLLIHTILELASIAISFSIFLYGWLAYSYTKSKLLLLVSLAFMTVGIFDVFHTFSYKGMPFLIAENFQTTVWFWLIGRLTEATMLIVGVFFIHLNSQVKSDAEKTLWFGFFVMVSFIVSAFILNYVDLLPVLINDSGPTFLKKALEYVIALMHLLAIFFIWKKYKQNKNQYYLNLIRACYFLILCGLTVTIFSTVYDLTVIVAHVFKVAGYFFILKAFYYANIQTPFEHKKQTEDKLHDIESELELLFDNTEDAILICDLTTKSLIRRNPAFKKIFGFDDDMPLKIDHIVPSYLSEEFEHVYQQLKVGKPVVDFVTVRQRKDLSLIDVSMTISPMKDKGDQVLCSAIIRDISAQKTAEREMKHARKDLQETLEQYHGTIFKFKKVDGQFVYTLIDGKMFRNKGILPEYAVGKPVQEFYPTSETELFDFHNQKAWLGQEKDFQFEDKEGSIFHVSLKPIKEENKTIEVIGNVVDITSLKKTEELLRKSEKLSVVGELAAGFAHEIRNPLTTVKGFLQLIGLEANEKNKEFVSIMLSEIDRLEMITNEFMVVAKPQVSSYQVEDIHNMMVSVISFLKPQSLLHSIEMEMNVHDHLPEIRCDKHQLRQVFINLYKNAMEAMPNGGTITTELSVEKNDWVSIAITDQGGGIPADIIPKLGEPFYTLKEKGTGLGLMVSKKIIESHQGNLDIKSEPNIGTTMTIRLPVSS